MKWYLCVCLSQHCFSVDVAHYIATNDTPGRPSTCSGACLTPVYRMSGINWQRLRLRLWSSQILQATQVWKVFRSEDSSKQEEHCLATNPQESSTSTRLFVDYKAKKGLFGSSGVTCITQATWLPSINSCLNQKTSSSAGLKIASDAEATTTFDVVRYGDSGDIFSQTGSQKWCLSPMNFRYLLLGGGCESQHGDGGPLNTDTFRLGFPRGPTLTWQSSFCLFSRSCCCKGQFFSRHRSDFVHTATVHWQIAALALVWWDAPKVTRRRQCWNDNRACSEEAVNCCAF